MLRLAARVTLTTVEATTRLLVVAATSTIHKPGAIQFEEEEVTAEQAFHEVAKDAATWPNKADDHQTTSNIVVKPFSF
jgi:hypothetical protein